MQSTSEWIDPRIRRTRQMLFVALEQLLQEKAIEDVSVADIASQAGLNRGTFYDHYADKFALLEGLVDSRFQELLIKRDIKFDGTCGHALVSITLATCHYLAESPHSQCPNNRQMEKHFEAAIASVIRSMILSGLNQHPPVNGLRPELVAASISGAIYGAAREWSSNPGLERPEDVGNAILEMFRPMLFPAS